MRYCIVMGLMLAGLVGTLGAGGCKSEPDEPRQPAAPEPLPAPEEVKPAPAELTQPGEACTYSYNPAETKLTWTAFKHTAKVAVPGTFTGIDVKGTQPASEPAKVFEHMTFEIDTSTVNTEKPDRDAKIKVAFFGTLTDGGKIRGEMKSLEEGKGTLELSLGGVAKPVELAYEQKPEDRLEATGKIDLTQFEGSAALKALNKICQVEHTGEDKVNKLWPDVELKVETKLDKTCP